MTILFFLSTGKILSDVPDFDKHPLIVRISKCVRSDHWEFGAELGVSMKDLEFLRLPTTVIHPNNVHRIFQCLCRSQNDSTKKNWDHILNALKRVDEKVLANEILEELCKSHICC